MMFNLPVSTIVLMTGLGLVLAGAAGLLKAALALR